MIYNTLLSVDKNDKLLFCPNCRNSEFDSDGCYCKICGKPRVNFCADEAHRNCGRQNRPNARYCEYCGSKTVFFLAGFLTPWKDVPEKEKTEDLSSEKVTFEPVVPEDDLPF